MLYVKLRYAVRSVGQKQPHSVSLDTQRTEPGGAAAVQQLVQKEVLNARSPGQIKAAQQAGTKRAALVLLRSGQKEDQVERDPRALNHSSWWCCK
jgi:hypothetical protein